MLSISYAWRVPRQNLPRIISTMIFLLATSLIAALAYLTPSKTGFGTHTQLIPIPCMFRQLLHVPCPSCGVTTSLSCILHGQFIDSLRAHPLGFFFFAIMIIIMIASLIGIIKNYSWWRVLEKKWLHISVIYGISALFIVWLLRLILGF